MAALTEVYLKVGITGILVIVFVYFLLKQIKHQFRMTEESNKNATKINETILCLFKNEIKDLGLLSKQAIEVGCDNTRLNKETIALINKTNESLSEHCKDYRQGMNQLVPAFNKLIDNLNGGNPNIIKIKERLDEIEKKIDRNP